MFMGNISAFQMDKAACFCQKQCKRASENPIPTKYFKILLFEDILFSGYFHAHEK